MAMSAKALDRTLRYSFVFGSSLGVSKVLFVNNLYYVAVGCTWMIIIHGQSMVFSSRKIKFPGISPKSHQKEAFNGSGLNYQNGAYLILIVSRFPGIHSLGVSDPFR